MGKGKIAATKPAKVEVIEGKVKYWCACGLSKKQPFCDGSHRKTELKPLKFVPEATGDVYLCMCKQTKTPPFCDGTHRTLKRSE